MSNLKKIVFSAFCLGFYFTPALAQEAGDITGFSQEEILNFDSQITVNQDGSMIVAETIQAVALNDQINHGIYRDFPTKYKDQLGNNYKVGFELFSAKRGGQPEGYHFESLSNGIRVYLGKQEILLEPGVYIYEIAYKTDRQLGFFADRDELYWNVTGNGWVFPIKRASARVILPGVPAKDIKLEGYTGPQGAEDKNFTAALEGDISVFTLTKPLNSYEGLSIVVGWPKGYVQEPTAEDKIKYFLKDNLGVIIGLAGLIVLLVYYFWAWNKAGKDPAKSAVIPQYEPPAGISPALAGYVKKMGYSQKTFTAAIIDLAVKGFIKIEKNGHYKIIRQKKDASVRPAEEKEILEGLLGASEQIDVKNSNHAKISAVLLAFRKSLKQSGEKRYFSANGKYLIPGLVFSAILLVAVNLAGAQALFFEAIFASIWLAVWTVAVVVLLRVVSGNWRGFLKERRKFIRFFQSCALMFILLPFFLGEGFGLVLLANVASFSSLFALLAVLAINIVFYFLLKAPTVEGRKIMDEIEGFKWFLSVTEKDRMNFHNPPDKTPELFEKFLPYALALGVENQWAEQFNDVFARLREEGRDYQPSWYLGSNFSALAAGNFASALGHSFSNAAAAAAAAPGSSSGFGGGGGSGGGGGGGGGGGW